MEKLRSKCIQAFQFIWFRNIPSKQLEFPKTSSFIMVSWNGVRWLKRCASHYRYFFTSHRSNPLIRWSKLRQMLVTNLRRLFEWRTFNIQPFCSLCMPQLYQSLSLFHIFVALRIKRGAWNEESLNRDLDLVEESIRMKRFGRGPSRTPFQLR